MQPHLDPFPLFECLLLNYPLNGVKPDISYLLIFLATFNPPPKKNSEKMSLMLYMHHCTGPWKCQRRVKKNSCTQFHNTLMSAL